MNDLAETVELGQTYVPPRQPQKGMPGIVVVLLLIVGVVGGGAGGWFVKQWYDQRHAMGVQTLAPGITVAPSAKDGYLLFTLDEPLAELWRSPAALEFKQVDVPVNADEMSAASADLEQAIRDRDDKGAIYRILCMLAAEPDVVRGAEWHLTEAVAHDRRSLVEGMVYARLREDAVDENGNNALHIAARHNRHHMVLAMLKSETFEIDARNSLGQTPLAVAAGSGSFQVVETIVEFAKSTDQLEDRLADTDNAGWTAHDIATDAKFFQIADYLLGSLRQGTSFQMQ